MSIYEILKSFNNILSMKIQTKMVKRFFNPKFDQYKVVTDKIGQTAVDCIFASFQLEMNTSQENIYIQKTLMNSAHHQEYFLHVFMIEI